MPMPRLTYQPSGMSRAVRCAISVRVSGFQGRSIEGSAIVSLVSGSGCCVGNVDDAVHKDAGSDYFLRTELAQLDDVLSLHDRQLAGGGHHRIEVPAGLAV